MTGVQTCALPICFPVTICRRLIPEFNKVIIKAKDSITAIRISVGKDLDELNAYLRANGINRQTPLGTDPGNAKPGNYETRPGDSLVGTGKNSITSRVQKDLANAEKIAETNSPSKRTMRLGKDIADGLAIGLEKGQTKVKTQSDRLVETATGQKYTSQQIKDKINFAKKSGIIPEGSQIIDAFTPTYYPNGKMVTDGEGNPLPPKTAKKLVTKYKRGVRREAVGNYSGKVAGGLGTAAMVSGMMGAPAAVTGALGTASMLSSFAPALAGMGPVGLTITAIGAVGASLKLLDKHFDDTAKKQAEYVRSISATTAKMKAIGELTGKVGASEIMARRRETGQYQAYNQAERKGSDFGQKFLTDATGQAIQKAFTSNIAKKGAKQAAQDLAFELSAYLS